MKTMETLIKYKKPIAAALLLIFVSITVFYTVGHIKDYFVDRRVAELEREQELHLQKIDILSQVISTKNAELALIQEYLKQSDAKLKELAAATSRARTIYVNRPNKPIFQSPDLEGRVKELTTLLNTLYPNTEKTK